MRQASIHLFYLISCIVLTAFFVIAANAQFKASVQGTVTDNSGAIVSGATVTLTNNETGQTQQNVATDDGFFRFSGLAPGLYTVTAEKEGFKKKTIENVKVDAEAIRGVDVALEAGVISEVVTVQAENVQLQTEDANIRKTITTEEILNLPQSGRDPYELARLTPGVFGTGARSADGSGTLLPNTSGPPGIERRYFRNRKPPADFSQRSARFVEQLPDRRFER